ncbi:O-antigen ligase family protein [Niveispirillum cyanobacteriorum]|nr:O-antigen ligase family protein [Niveispirillum cyanobacteriorum]GGE69270.1 O-antigen polymerase [Niveispirillum cyanobacteriorum]
MAMAQDGQDPAFTSIFILFGVLIMAVFVPLIPLALAPGVTALAVLFTGLSVWRRHYPRPDRFVVVALGLFLVWSGASLFWTGGGGKGITAWAGFLYIWIPGLCLLSLLPSLSDGAARRIAHWLLPAVAVGAMLLAIELLFDQPIQHLFAGSGKEALDFERDLNRASLLLALMAGPVALLLWRLGHRRLAAVALALPLLLVADSTSQSSVAALLGLVILLGLACLSWRVTAGLLAVGIVAGLTLCGPIAIWMKQVGLADADWMPLSFRHRILTWDFVAGRLGDHPWIGYGLEGSRAVPGTGGAFILPGVGPVPILPVHPHNVFQQVRLELGWIGAALVGLLLLAILRRLTRLDPAIRPMALALFGAVIFTQCFAYGAWQAWLICGMLFAGALVTLAGRIKDPS